MSTEETAAVDKDSAARQRIVDVTQAVMQRAADSLQAMSNHIIEQVREEPKFLAAILTPDVNMNLDIQVPDDLERKIMVLVADCVAKDRVETLTLTLGMLDGEPQDIDAVREQLREAEAEAAEIAKAAAEVKKAKPIAKDKGGPGIVMPEGLVKCPGCGGAAQPLSKCSACGTETGLRL
jgi:ATP-dependent Lon protease